MFCPQALLAQVFERGLLTLLINLAVDQLVKFRVTSLALSRVLEDQPAILALEVAHSQPKRFKFLKELVVFRPAQRAFETACLSHALLHCPQASEHPRL